MPIDRRKYPENWEAIAHAVKKTANWRCQLCGKQCRRPEEKFDTHKRTATAAHRNHLPRDCRPENLFCACAPCHLKFDAMHHARSAATTRRLKKLRTIVTWNAAVLTIGCGT